MTATLTRMDVRGGGWRVLGTRLLERCISGIDVMLIVLSTNRLLLMPLAVEAGTDIEDLTYTIEFQRHCSSHRI